MTQQNPPRGDLTHYGVKGMHWGVRKADESGSGSQSSAINVEAGINSRTSQAALEVSGLMKDRYGYDIKNVKRIENSPNFNGTDIAFVENNRLASGRNDGTIFVQSRDLTKIMKSAEPDWNAPGTGNVKGLLTHESAHALFHSNQEIKTSLLGGQKVAGGDIKARDKALRAAEKAAARDGQTVWDSSGYARTALERGELEAELFSQYHWATDPPNFVKVWGETLHREMGIDSTPFKEVK